MKQMSTKLLKKTSRKTLIQVLNYSMIVFASITVIGSLFFLVNFEMAINFLERISPDQEIQNPQRVIQTFYLLMIASIGTGFLLKGIIQFFPHNFSLSQIPIDIWLFMVSGIFLMVLNYDLDVTREMYREDGFLETLTVIFLFLALIILLVTAFREKQLVPKIFLFGLVFCTFVFGMEEISWGQRIIGWETPEALKTVNRQEESNLHNIFNEVFDLLYAVCNIIIGGLLLFRKWIVKQLERNYALSKIIPYYPPGQFYFAGILFFFLLPYTIFWDQRGETFEEVFALLLFIYAFNLLSPQKVFSLIRPDALLENAI